MVFIRDTRDKIDKHKNVDNFLEENGHKIVRSKLYVGDVSLLNDQSVCIDLKQGISEVYSNIIQQNVRFKNECVRAKEAGIRLIILIPDFKINSVQDVHTWNNPRRIRWMRVHEAHKEQRMLYIQQPKKPPASSEQLQKAMETISERYGVEWVFCKHENIGKTVFEILTKDKP